MRGCRQGRRGTGPSSTEGTRIFAHAQFLLDDALKFTEKTSLLDGNPLLYTAEDIIFDRRTKLVTIIILDFIFSPSQS